MRTFINNSLVHIRNIRRRNLVIGGIIFTVLLVGIIWYKWPYKEYKEVGMRPNWNIAENIMQAPGSQIFASAVYNLEYTTFLEREGPYTVFIPSDAAYNKLSVEQKYFLADTSNQGSIRQVVLYHVVPGRYKFSDLKDGMVLTTVQGEELVVTHSADQVILNGNSFIENYDIMAKNGVIHTVNNYLLPSGIGGSQ